MVDEEVITEVEQYFNDLNADNYKIAIMTFQHRCCKYVNVEEIC